MNSKSILLSASAILAATAMVACSDNLSEIGPSISQNEVTIIADSLTYDMHAVSIYEENYDARTTTNMIGRLAVPEYGDLYSSFVSRLMCSATFPVPDSIPSERVDSVKLLLSVVRGSLTGDSLAPQQMEVYRLTKQLPNNITNDFDPEGYYSKESLLGKKNYTLSAVAMNDTAFKKLQYLTMQVPINREFGVELFNAYRSNPEIFEWPQTFAQYFPGIYVRPSFGNGCVANVIAIQMMTYFYTLADVTETVDSVTVTKQVHQKDSVTLLSSAPEVLSSNVMRYKMAETLRQRVADGECIITTPGGFISQITFPTQEIVEKYKASTSTMTVISDLTMSIPAEEVTNDYGITVAPYMLLIKSSEVDDFFSNSKLPDNKTSFYATYSSSTNSYDFGSMRNYILSMVDKGEITADDITFSLIPVMMSTENQTNSYTGEVTVHVTGCQRYIGRPTMTKLDTKSVAVNFIYSKQVID